MNRLASPAQIRASFVRWALFAVPAVLLLGFISGRLGPVDTPWFQALDKPEIFPPPRIFGIVWPFLYALMGFSIAIVASAWGARWRGPAIAAFILQLAVNLAWTPVFFAGHEMTIALYVILALVVLLSITIWLFWKVRRVAAVLLVPYLAWILFASVLNWQFLDLNRDLDGADVSNPVQRFEI